MDSLFPSELGKTTYVRWALDKALGVGHGRQDRERKYCSAARWCSRGSLHLQFLMINAAYNDLDLDAASWLYVNQFGRVRFSSFV